MENLAAEQYQWEFYNETHKDKLIKSFEELSYDNKNYIYNNICMLLYIQQQEKKNGFSIVRRTV